jgi:VanZ family protein
MTDMLRRYRIIRSAIPPVFILWTLLMLLLTLLPGEVLPSARLFSYDKIGHFGMFGGWTFFLGLYMIVYKEKVNINLFLLMMAGILFGAAIEGLQYLMPMGRAASWGDIIANSLGCFAAYLVLHPVRNYLKRGK